MIDAASFYEGEQAGSGARFLECVRDALLSRIEEYAAERNQPIADPEVAQVERILVRALRPRRIIEVGTNIGYSVIVMGRECGRETVLETIEIDREILATAKKFVAE